MAFTRTTLVRNLSRTELLKIAEILNENFAWKKLMQIVPFELTHQEQLNEDKPKYDFHHIKLVENAAATLKKPAAQIFLEEWSTSGRIQPSLSHLLELLIKSVLFRAADYVAVHLLSEAPPQRPTKGPAAKVDITLPPDDDSDEDDQDEDVLPHSSDIVNINGETKEIRTKQILNQQLKTDESGSSTRFNDTDFKPLIDAETRSQLSFAGDSSYLPEFSEILQNTPYRSTITQEQGTIAEETLSDHYSEHVRLPQSDSCVPMISMLNMNQGTISTKSSTIEDITAEIPNISALNLDSADTQNSKDQQEFSEIIPHLSALLK
ncbi:Protein Tube [Pseudolycoriella hygida]|uniref:Protein Tube n=1 Tax=Pseudolycoriella hygida TaxID=35572 RepID=A0A9Q0NFZ3_9DIPT|nr:Protein Tube [Pseudolycoriella hygida]